MVGWLESGHPLAGCVEYAWSASASARPGAPSDALHERTSRRALPDGRVELIWTPYGFAVGGHVTRHVQFPQAGVPYDLSGVQFRVGAAGPVLGIDPTEVAEETVMWRDLIGREADLLAERVAAGATPEARAALILDVLAERAAGLRPDPLVGAAVARLARPQARVADVGREVGLSERQLRRRFLRDVGFGLKTLHRIERFRGFVAGAGRHGDLGRAAYDAGYADQSHLVRESHALAGIAPRALLRELGSPA